MQNDENIQKMRLFPQKNGLFNNELRVEEGQAISFLIPKAIKGSYSFNFSDSEVKIIGMYNEKNYKVGHLTLDIVADSP